MSGQKFIARLRLLECQLFPVKAYEQTELARLSEPILNLHNLQRTVQLAPLLDQVNCAGKSADGVVSEILRTFIMRRLRFPMDAAENAAGTQFGQFDWRCGNRREEQ